MSLLRFLGLGNDGAGRDAEPEAILELAERLEATPTPDARLAAAFAYLLARVADADLNIDAAEQNTMRDRIAEFGEISPDQALMLAEAASGVAQSRGTDDHLVARAFRDMTDREERLRLLRCLYAVAAADDTISNREDNEIFEIATAIGIGRSDVIAVRARWKDYLGSMKALPKER
jgi:uncharacterized tellurite resistance protein B-like protein